jgi:hypothetical protein
MREGPGRRAILLLRSRGAEMGGGLRAVSMVVMGSDALLGLCPQYLIVVIRLVDFFRGTCYIQVASWPFSPIYYDPSSFRDLILAAASFSCGRAGLASRFEGTAAAVVAGE